MTAAVTCTRYLHSPMTVTTICSLGNSSQAPCITDFATCLTSSCLSEPYVANNHDRSRAGHKMERTGNRGGIARHKLFHWHFKWSGRVFQARTLRSRMNTIGQGSSVLRSDVWHVWRCGRAKCGTKTFTSTTHERAFFGIQTRNQDVLVHREPATTAVSFLPRAL